MSPVLNIHIIKTDFSSAKQRSPIQGYKDPYIW